MHGLRAALGWLIFPLVPALLAGLYHGTANWSFSDRGGPDPRDWNWFRWVLLTGPLFGYGFLAGATLDLPDDSPQRWWRGWLGRRSVWVAVGPWSGFLVCAAGYWTLVGIETLLPASQEHFNRWQQVYAGTWTEWVLGWALGIGLVVTLSFGWTIPAWAALRRARRIGALLPALQRGLGVALMFLGTLFGTFWALTERFRSYFFDPRIMPVLLGLLVLSGCGNETYGEVRRRELFQALLMAWVLGLALLWRWWSRPRGKP